MLLCLCVVYSLIAFVSASGTCTNQNTTVLNASTLADVKSAISCANSNTESTYTIHMQSDITLDEAWNSDSSSGIQIKDNATVTIKGSQGGGVATQIIGSGPSNHASAEYRLFEVRVGARLSLENIVLRNGFFDNGQDGKGGALLVEGGTIIMNNCTLSGNTANHVSSASHEWPPSHLCCLAQLRLWSMGHGSSNHSPALPMGSCFDEFCFPLFPPFFFGQGGALHARHGGSIIMDNCIVRENTAYGNVSPASLERPPFTFLRSQTVTVLDRKPRKRWVTDRATTSLSYPCVLIFMSFSSKHFVGWSNILRVFEYC